MLKASWIAPTKNISTNDSATYSGEPSAAYGTSTVGRTIESATVGPLTKCQLEPKSAATTEAIIALYSPNNGGTPAISAKAIACGNTSAAPVSPAQKSPRSDVTVAFGQRRHGHSIIKKRQNTSSSTPKIPFITNPSTEKTPTA